MYPSLFTTPGLARFAEEIDAERARQLAKFGDQQHPDGTGLPIYEHAARRYRDQADRNAQSGVLAWRDVLLEEVYEALAESDPVKLRAELVQVAAVCAAWVSDIDRRPTPVTEDLPSELLIAASGDLDDVTYKPALCGCGNPTHAPLTECPPAVDWVTCTPRFLRLIPDACRTLLRMQSANNPATHFHPQPERP